MKKTVQGVGEVTVPSTFKEKMQNFWYHYKWHSLAAFILVIAIFICTFQFCTLTKYDAYIMYAGGKNIGRTASDGDFAEIEKVISALKGVTEDFDKNGEVSPNFVSYFYLSSEEASDRDDVNDLLLANDRKSIQSVFEHSEYYLCFISKSVYEEYGRVGDDEIFLNLNEFKKEGVEFYTDSAILFSSLDASKLSGFSTFPDDTLVCIRRPSVLGGKSKEHQRYVENAKDILTNLINIKID